MAILDLLFLIDWRTVLRFVKARPVPLVVIGAVLPGVLAAVVEFVVTDGVSGVVPIASAALGGLVTAVVLYLLITLGPVSDSPEQGTATFTDSGRFFSRRTPAELVAEIEDKTTIFAERISDRHRGHWIAVDGFIRDVRDDLDEVTVHLQIEGPPKFISLGFTASAWKDKLISLDIGDQISVIGKIHSIAEYGITLENCELVQR